jgi:hypothetical protein
MSVAHAGLGTLQPFRDFLHRFMPILRHDPVLDVCFYEG